MIRSAAPDELQRRGEAMIAAAGQETGEMGPVAWDRIAMLHASGALWLRVVELDGALVGYCAALASPPLWGGGMTMGVLSVYVQPQHRGRWGVPLLRELLRHADALRASVDIVAPAPRAELLHRLGFQLRALALRRPNMQYTAHGLRH